MLSIAPSSLAERVREAFCYNPETGLLTWAVQKSATAPIGAVAGCPSGGYLVVRLDDVLYKVHRIIFLYMTGKWPIEFIDHKDGDRSNNRWANLREASNEQNGWNARTFVTNTSGFKGVSLHKASGLYQAYIWSKNKKISLGYRRNPEDAYALYCSAALRLRGEFARVA